MSPRPHSAETATAALILHWAHEPKHILHQGLARTHLLTRSVHRNRLYCQGVRTLGLGLNPGQTLPLVARLQLFAVLLLAPRLLLAPCQSDSQLHFGCTFTPGSSSAAA